MSKSKKYAYNWDEIYEEKMDTDASTMAEQILQDPELPNLEEIIIGCWGESYDNSSQAIVDSFTDNREKFQHIEKLFVGDMEYDECEVSWIEQADYSKLWDAWPQLKSLTVKGSNDLSFGKINHDNLQELVIICGGLPARVIQQIADAKLPNLRKLNLYIGIEDYGFDGDISDIEKLLKADFIKNVEYLGLGDSEIQDEIVEAFFKHADLGKIKTLDFSNGTLTDKGGQILLDHAAKLKQLEKLDLTYHYLSDEMMEKLKATGLPVVLEEQQEADDDGDGGYWYSPMLTE